MNCVGMSLTGISPSYVILLFLVGTAGLGAAAFHPPAFSTVARSSTTWRGGSLGIFLSGGNAGFAIGLLIVAVVVGVVAIVVLLRRRPKAT